MFFGKKKKNEIEDDDDDKFLEEDEFDFDDLGDFDEFDGNPREPSKKELAKTVGKEAAKELGSKVRKETFKEVIPGDFESNYLEVKDFASHTKNLLTDSVKEITDSVGKLLPESLAEKLGIGRKDEQQRQISEAEAREAGIQNSINAIFNKQKNIEEKLERDEDVKREVITESTKLAVSKLQADVMGGMSNDISKLSGFFLDIGNEYFKKSLELQFKSYYSQLDLLKLSSTYFKGFSEQFDKLVKNTALPEHVKITQAERVEGKMRDAIADKVYATAWTNNRYVQNIKNNLERRIKGFTSDIKGSIDSARSVLEMSDDAGGRYDMVARVIGSMLGEKAANKFMEKFRPHLKDKLDGNTTLRHLGFLSENITKNTSGVFARLRERASQRIDETEGEEGVRNKLANHFWRLVNSGLDLGRMSRRDMRIPEGTMDNINEPAIFDNHVYRTVTDAIPQYLSRILQQNVWLTRMYRARNSDHKGVVAVLEPTLLHYNYISRKLDSMDNYRTSVTNYLTRRDSNQGYKTAGRRTMQTIADDLRSKKDEGWRKEVKYFSSGRNLELLDNYMEAVSSKEGVDGNFDEIFTKALTDDANISVREYLADNPATAKLIKRINEHVNNKSNETIHIKAKDYLKTAKTDVNNNYPLGTIKEVVANVSKLSGSSESINKLNDEEATTLGRAIARFQRNPNNVLIANDRVIRSIFTPENLVGERNEDTVLKLAIFVNDIADIINSGERDRIEELQLMLGVLDSAIRGRLLLGGEGEDFLKDRLMKIVNANPEIYDGVKEFGVEHMLEGFVGSASQYNEFIDPRGKGFDLQDIETIFDSVAIKEVRANFTDRQFLKNIDEKFTEFRNRWSEGNTIGERFANVLDYTKEEFGKSLEVTRNKFEEKTRELIGKAKEFTANMSAEAASSTMNWIYNYVNQTKLDAKEQREVDVRTFEEGIANLEEVIRNLISESNSDESEIERLRKEVVKLRENNKKKIAAYDTLIKSLEETENKLLSITPEKYTKEVIRELPGKIRDIFGEGMFKLGALLNVTKKEKI